ncbi:MAG TPA: metallophosphoesterase [Azonexus sp.]|nr:metallophosphoesterase [Azonexus sp.]
MKEDIQAAMDLHSTSGMLNFLHITDSHLTPTEVVETMDIKVNVPGVTQPLRIDLLQATVRNLREKLQNEGSPLHGVIFSGDGTLKGDSNGQVALRNMLLEELGPLGITPARIVATPGNHDIVSGSEPNGAGRYELFQKAWLNPEPVVVPFLEGVHRLDALNIDTHVLRDPNGEWAVFPINSANWSQTRLAENGDADFASLKKYIEASGQTKLAKALNKLCTPDIARISEDQLNALKKMVDKVGNVRLRIAVLHHHLLPVGTREEFKSFADITNLGHLRQVLRELKFHIVIHGHKHITTAYYDHVYPDEMTTPLAHRILTISGGTYGPSGAHPDEPLRLIKIGGIPHAPFCDITTIKSAESGRELKTSESPSYRLWEEDPTSQGPAAIFGTSIDDVYLRALQTVDRFPNRPIVCTIDFPLGDAKLPFPKDYPRGGNDEERREWFQETVEWWQLHASRIEARIPYLHGSRLKRFGGGYDQIDRVVRLLGDKKPTSKAIALVVDPGRDFVDDENPFASFCFIQFCLRVDKKDRKTLDCIGYYRAQEFKSWWPVNVAELRHLQWEVANKADITPGKITTITPYPRLDKDHEKIRHPTKVAVPLVDQWVDNHPEHIAKIALFLSNSAASNDREGELLWRRFLDDLKQSAYADFHIDGMQVAIDGLELLLVWLEAVKGPKEVVHAITELLDMNKLYDRTPQVKKDFTDWQEQVRRKLSFLEELSSTTNLAN